jgi:hypothetical protein
MALPRSLGRWLLLPSRVALILGIGALSTTGARADVPEPGNATPFGGVLVRSQAGRIYLSEGGRETELRPSATPQHSHLLRLLEEHGSAGVKLNCDPYLLMSSGGGSSFFWRNTKAPVAEKPTASPQDPPQVTPPPSLPDPRLAPPDQRPAAEEKG